MGGENAGVAGLDDYGRGSSPRGRGKHHYHPKSPSETRLIPAWAGKTADLERNPELEGAHPRVGGENHVARGCPIDGEGSSPRGRGKPFPAPSGTQTFGLIPAWAGKTCGGALARCCVRAHPRVGGENRWRELPDLYSHGSSPRGRGKLARRGSTPRRRGLIPAWAGKTAWRGTYESTGEAHPRVGGENPATVIVRPWPSGSSPRGRGKRAVEHKTNHQSGLIPAWAGKTLSASYTI